MVEAAGCVECLYRASNHVNAILVTIIYTILAEFTLCIWRSHIEIAHRTCNSEIVITSVKTL